MLDHDPVTPDAFAHTGYAVFPQAVDPATLERLRAACEAARAAPAPSSALDVGGRVFLDGRHEELGLEDVLTGPIPHRIVSACLGTPGYLFYEQFVVKDARTGGGFAWHQDSAYVGVPHAPYLTVWIALDDATLENGCVYLLPRDIEAAPGIDRHEWVEETRELNGYFGDETGVAMTARAGDVVAFSSLTLHRSGANRTDAARRAYVTQFSPEPILDPETGEPKTFAKEVRGREEHETI